MKYWFLIFFMGDSFDLKLSIALEMFITIFLLRVNFLRFDSLRMERNKLKNKISSIRILQAFNKVNSFLNICIFTARNCLMELSMEEYGKCMILSFFPDFDSLTRKLFHWKPGQGLHIFGKLILIKWKILSL